MLLSLISVIVTLWVSGAHGQEATCDPPTLENGLYIPVRKKYTLEYVITYWCNKRHYPARDGFTTKCTEKGWHPPPICAIELCELPEIKHGRLYRDDILIPRLQPFVGRQYPYSCDDNYVTPTERRRGIITCTPDGWSPKVPCLRKCVLNRLEHGYSPINEQIYLQGEFVQVLCYLGYSLLDQQNTLTCTENGWYPPPKCVRVVTCLKSDIQIENGFMSEPKLAYSLNNEAKYKCKPGYVTEEGQTSGSVTCLQRGWSARPRCIRLCGMPVFENAMAVITGQVFRPNDTLAYQCLDGYENRDGRTTGSMVCGEDGWSHLPTCFKSAEKCGRPPAVSNGDLTSFPLTAYPPGSRVEYQCQAYYQLRGPKHVTCSYAKWSEPPRCIDPCVISQEIMNENNIELKGKDDKTYYARTGDVIEFTCKSGHSAVTSEQSFQAVCREGTVQLPRCG
ncbi:complement factor H-related protein 4-like isoform X2 [Pteronotus mesoamericanus]|uniref:complement factor H-related protein 4-like isoform X2 n=1 Tax=Pteronotus mesoamericanus TaxID=1884717 RepID=UPI0023EB5AEC|nr:complement factor H-related protein 4-like isoform X2 [Pteronotus parnellii mesoamericanus]